MKNITSEKLEQYISKDWKNILNSEFNKPYFQTLNSFLTKAYKNENIYPKKQQIFKALNLTPIKACKVVIIGQDPYHGKNQANGLAFSVSEGVKLPPSLKNIIKEIKNSTNMEKTNGNLSGWAKQGVLLINSILTVKEKTPGSHKKIGWQQFTNKIIELLNNQKRPIVFMLWGNYAQSKQNLITNPIHIKLKAPHPSPLSANRGFFGCDHFKLTNSFLAKTKQNPINWKL